MAAPRILVFAGSLRHDSFNKKLARVAADATRAAGGEVTYVDLKDLPMPIYDADIEKTEGLPPNAKKFKELMLANDALIISSPEYNSSITGVLKNTIDWASRSEAGEPALACFQNKVAALFAASPGALGGLRSLVTLRSILGSIQVLVLPDQLTVAKAHEAFDEAGKLKDAKQQASVERIAAKLVSVVARLRAGS